MELDKFSESEVIKGLLFSTHDKYGPQPKFVFPKEVSDQEAEELKKQNIQKLTFRDYMQISIKNISLFITDLTFSDYEENSQDIPHFGIIPFPDFKLTSLTFFNYMKIEKSEEPLASSFSVLVDENKRNYLYHNLERLKPIILSFCTQLEQEISIEHKTREELIPIFKELLQKLIDIEKKPYTSITSKRKMKILFAGLDDSGKTSFLLSVNKKYSKLIGLKPTLGAEIKSIEALGSSILVWDLGGQLAYREKYMNKAHIYLYDADLIFYFIDIKNRKRFQESFDYLQTLKLNLKQFKQKSPFVYILSKGDKDIIGSREIKNNLNHIKSKLIEITSDLKTEIYITSIFSIFSILRAFSSGISKLNPNREIINLNLKNFSNRVGVYLSLILNNEGLTLADFYSPKAFSLLGLKASHVLGDKENLRNIFEVTGPQFAILYKIFSQFQALQKEEARFNISKSIILLKKFQINDSIMFILFLLDKEIKKEKINELLPDFLNRTGDLLVRYIS